MIKSKTSTLIGFLMFVSFCILSTNKYLIANADKIVQHIEKIIIIGIIEVLAFLVPTLLSFLTRGKSAKKFHKLNKIRLKDVSFIILYTVSLTILAFIVNNLVYKMFFTSQPSVDDISIFFSGNVFFNILVIAIIPAVVEEIFFRGVVFSFLQDKNCTYMAMFFSGLFFAMIHGSFENFAGPLVAGIGYAYLAYSLGSVMPAIVSHAIYNLFSMYISRYMSVYVVLGIWDYVVMFLILLFLLCTYLALNKMEHLVLCGHIAKFQKGCLNLSAAFLDTLINPGVIVFLFAFLSKALFKFW